MLIPFRSFFGFLRMCPRAGCFMKQEICWQSGHFGTMGQGGRQLVAICQHRGYSKTRRSWFGGALIQAPLGYAVSKKKCHKKIAFQIKIL